MGTLFSTLDIARSGLQAAQVQMDVAGHNIANVNTEGFSRQRAELLARDPNYRSYGALGRGVEVQNIERVRDAFLDTVYRQQFPELGLAEVRDTYLTQIEEIFQEPDEDGLGTRLNDFFDVLNDFANNVEESAVRQSVITEAENLATTLRQVDERIELLRTNANEEAKNLVPEINSLAERIAALNVEIRNAELDGTNANDLRDERDLLLDEVSGLVNITTRERTDGQIDVLIGGDVLVSGNTTRELVAEREASLDPSRSDLVEIRFVDTGESLNLSSGELYGALSVRDNELVEYSQLVDTLTASIIQQVNAIHAQGNGIENLSGTITSSSPIEDVTAALQDAGLPFAITDGSFDVVVYDDADPPVATTTTITITAATTAQDLVNDLNAIANFSATLNADGTIDLGADTDYTFAFANDSAGALTALGINGLFTGSDAGSIAVNQDILDNPLWLTSGFSLDVLETGDNEAALALADIRNALALEDGSATINDFYESLIARIGNDVGVNQDLLAVENTLIDDYSARREATSGVSLDEEVTNLVQYQRAYEASATLVTTTNQMLEALINMV